MKQDDKRRCKWCGIAKAMRRRQRICDQCKSGQFFKTKHWVWLESLAIKYGVQCWPATTEEMIELLELRQVQNHCKGISRRSGFMWANYNYELAHRFPASQGGKLVADNLVLMPSQWNKTMSNRHGHGLERFQVDSVNKLPRGRLKSEFKSRYDLTELERFSTMTRDNGADFENEGVGVLTVLKGECERLGVSISLNEDMDMEEKVMEALSKYEEICGNDGDLVAMVTSDSSSEVSYDISGVLDTDRSWWVQSFEASDIANLSDIDFKEALKWKHKLREKKPRERDVYLTLILDTRNDSDCAKAWRNELYSHWDKLRGQGQDMPF